jgi:transposase
MIRFDDLPSDPLLLKQKLIETTSIIAKVSAEKVALADERNVAIAQRDSALQENEKLLLILSQYKRALFGRRSEKMDADQLQLLLSGNEASIVAGAANENAAANGAGNDTKAGAADKPARPRPNRNRGTLPAHLPRVDVVIDVESKICPCCGGSLHKIGETIKEMFDVVPVQYRVKRMVRPRYGCRGCESAVVQAPAPAQPIDGGMATEAVLAHVATMKYGYQEPLAKLSGGCDRAACWGHCMR